jgi:hypothetical protein
MVKEKKKSLPKDIYAWLKNILEKSESFQGTEVEKQANDEQLFMEVFDELVKQFRANPDLSKDIPPIPPDVNQGILRGTLFIYAQVYYRIIEVVSSGEVAYADLLLNQYYLQVVKKIKYLLSLDGLKGFTGEFNPPEHILPSYGLGDIGWEDGLAPHTESFLVSVQTFLNELDFCGNEPAEVTIVLKWLRKHIEPIIEKIEEYRQTTKKYFNGLVENLKHEKEGIEKAAKRKEQNEPCTKNEYNRFVLIYGHLKDLTKLLRKRSIEDEDKIAYKQIELDEDVKEFWPTLKKIGLSVGIDISDKFNTLKEIIFDKEVENPYTALDAPFTIDGKWYDEIQAEEMAKKYDEEAMQPRYDLICDLNRIKVRLNKCFDVNNEVKLQQPSSQKPTAASGGKVGDNIQTTFETTKRKVESIRDQVFICYSHKDERWLNDLQTHLKPYVRNGLTAWSDKQIAPGSKWLPEIETALASAKVAVLLVTPYFLDSDFIHEKELGPLLKKAEKGKVRIIWIPVRACAYKETLLKDYQAAGDPEKPLEIMKANRNKAWVKICEEIKKAVKATPKI